MTGSFQLRGGSRGEMRAQSEVAPSPPPPLSLSRFNVEDFHINVKETAGRYQFGVEVRRVSLQVEDNLLCATLC